MDFGHRLQTRRRLLDGRQPFHASCNLLQMPQHPHLHAHAGHAHKHSSTLNTTLHSGEQHVLLAFEAPAMTGTTASGTNAYVSKSKALTLSGWPCTQRCVLHRRASAHVVKTGGKRRKRWHQESVAEHQYQTLLWPETPVTCAALAASCRAPPSPPFPNTLSSTYDLHQATHAHTSTRRAPPCPGMYMVCGWHPTLHTQPRCSHCAVSGGLLNTDYGSLHAMCAAFRGDTHCQGVLACCVVTCIIRESANHGASIGSQATPADLTKLRLQMVDTVVHQCAYEEQPGARHLPNMAAGSA